MTAPEINGTAILEMRFIVFTHEFETKESNLIGRCNWPRPVTCLHVAVAEPIPIFTIARRGPSLVSNLLHREPPNRYTLGDAPSTID
ncbi:hypothetical protein [Trinickia dinghuensis]|uniref:hypothetical protein n=1 Tax=Trinickia dinghuensis TaxID=2291023 RepID=UPI0011C08096|nr:hypothetical protein [Trinickia dinghuensis]